MTIKLFDIAEVIRSKNSGPYELTFDIIFNTYEDYKMVMENDVINEDMFSKLYKIDKKDIIGIVGFEPAKAIKITIVRPLVSGDVGEPDVYGAQQHVPLMDFEFKL